MNDWSIIFALGATALSAIALLNRAFDKSLSIREHEAYKAAVERDIHRVEGRLNNIESTRPTVGELEILAESLNKRIDHINTIRRN